MSDDEKTAAPTRDHQDDDAFGQDGQTVSDQQGETAPENADEPKDGKESAAGDA